VECSISQLLSEEEVDVSDEGSLLLAACPLASEVQLGEPVRVLVLLQNLGPRPVRVLNTLDLNWNLTANVVSPDGQYLSSLVSHGHTIVVDTMRATLLIPVKGFIGRVVGLDCYVMNHGVPSSSWENCLPSVRFDQVGRYKISLEYDWLGFHPDLAALKTGSFEVRVTQDE
jgi:hypothetical protein